VSEKALWEWLRGVLPRGHYSRIESPETAPGHPDVSYTVQGDSGTLELKFSKHPGAMRPFKHDGLREKTQIPWITAEVAAKGCVWIVGQVGDRVYWVFGSHAKKFNNYTIKQLNKAASIITPREALQERHLELMALSLSGYIFKEPKS
jgi:hypothetical protein